MLIVDGDPLTRLGIIAYLTGAKLGCRCTEAENGRRAREACAGGAPEVILIDVPMTKGDGLGLVRELSKLVPKARVVVLGAICDQQGVDRVFRAGAHGFVDRQDAPGAFPAAIAAVLGGERFVSHTAEQALYAELSHRRTAGGGLAPGAMPPG